ncbi:hypothetical protein ABT147_34715 [Streptomyces sp. NPDC001868]|uniref:hypothetical protein n=1 Tax=Streptomyces sp. NPDC001868 TaxID=3154401 RepID=UPI003320F311
MTAGPATPTTPTAPTTRAASVRRRVRVAAAAAGLAAALVLTGCSSDDGGSEAKESSPAPTATDGGGSGDSGDSSGTETELQGNWLATTDGKAVALFVNGDEVAVFAGTAVCGGKVSDAANMRMISLKCQDGSDDRTEGMVDKVSAKSLTITWEGGVGEETFQKAEGSLPSGLPTDLPTASAGS